MGVGASAGGLEAFSQLLAALPDDSGMAFVLIQHLDPTHQSHLADLLGKASRMPVVEARDGQRLEADHVYVIAPNTAVALGENGELRVTSRVPDSSAHLPIDVFFRSLAERRRSAAIGVVLSGSGSDGMLGLGEIKGAGGITFAQDEATAKFIGMPRSAVHSGFVDLVLEPEAIAAELLRLAKHPLLQREETTQPAGAEAPLPDEGVQAILALLRGARGVDFNAYRPNTLRRRVLRRVMLSGSADLAQYIDRLRADRAELEALYQDILINVTSFFREPEVFAALQERVFPRILEGKKAGASVRLWVPGCSTGQEAYSLGMALLETMDATGIRLPVQVFATDLSDNVSLVKARAGLYPDSIEAEVTPERLRRFFQKEGGHYRVVKSLRDMVVFARQNVVADPPFSRVDLVSCRNLLIYLSPPLQKRVLPTFHYSLNVDGFLVLGGAESIGQFTDLFEAVDKPLRIYQRRSATARAYPSFQASERAMPGIVAGEPASERVATADWQREADRVAAGRYMPPGVLINGDFDVLQFRGQTGPFLAPAPGEPSNNVLKMARVGLFLPLRTAVGECQRTGQPVRHPDVRVRGEGTDHQIELQVLPIKLPIAGDACYLVLFEEISRRAVPLEQVAQERQADEAGELHHLRQELASTRDYLQSVIEQQDATNEELKSSTEEILSSNEELQSTNEELETAKEELQSVNEELTTVNEQLEHRNAELGRLGDDLANVLTSIGVPTVVLDRELRIRRFTPAAADLFRLGSRDVGRRLGPILPQLDGIEFERLLDGVVSDMRMVEREVTGPDARGWLLRAHPYRTADHRIDGVVLVMHDVHELHRSLDELQAASDYANAIIETVREPLVVLDDRLQVRSANHAFYSTFQVAPDATLGRTIFELGDRQWDIPQLRAKLSTVLSSDASFADFEVRHDFESVGTKVMRLNARRVDRDGELPRLVLLAIEDHTEIARLEQLAEAHMAQLSGESARKSAFLAVLAHELRNPLAPITTALEMLGHELSPMDAKKARAIIERQTAQLGRLVEDLVDVARIDRGRIELRKASIDLGPLVEAVADACRSSFANKDIALSCTVPPQPLVADVDPARLHQVVGNLLSNACKFTPRGGHVRLDAFQDGEHVVLRVVDDGIGIDAGDLPRVFDMFMQADTGMERTNGGLGIGLSLVQQLVVAHGGTITVASPGLDQGSAFEIRLPLGRAPPAVLEAAGPQPVAANAMPRRVLVADDNEDAVELIATVLRYAGHDVHVAHNGLEALRMAECGRYDVILLDIGMPGLNGYEVARRIRAYGWGRQVLLVAITGWGQPEDVQRATDAGFDRHFVKPIDEQSLLGLMVDLDPLRRRA